MGEFYYPNKLQLDEAKAAEVDVHQWVGEPGASCTDTCATKNMLCVPEVCLLYIDVYGSVYNVAVRV